MAVRQAPGAPAPAQPIPQSPKIGTPPPPTPPAPAPVTLTATPAATAGAGGGNPYAGTGTGAVPVNSADAGAEISANLVAAGMDQATANAIGAWALKQYASGNSINQITQQVYSTPAFQAATPGFAERVQNGFPGMTVSDYFTYKATVQAQAKAAGFPKGFVSNDEIGALVANNVSADEVSARINDAFATAQNAPPEITKALQDYYHVGPGGVAAYFLDPTKATDVLHQQATAAIIGGEGAIAGFGEVSAADALRFAKASGLTGESATAATAAAQGALGGVSGDVSLTKTGVATAPGTSATTSQVEGAALLGDYADKAAVNRAAEQKNAAFRGGGGFAGQGQPGQPTGAGYGAQ